MVTQSSSASGLRDQGFRHVTIISQQDWEQMVCGQMCTHIVGVHDMGEAVGRLRAKAKVDEAPAVRKILEQINLAIRLSFNSFSPLL